MHMGKLKLRKVKWLAQGHQHLLSQSHFGKLFWAWTPPETLTLVTAWEKEGHASPEG